MGHEVESLFRREYPRLVRALTLATGDPEVAADVVQDAFVQAHRHWRRVSAYDDPAAWLRRVAVNRLANRRRGTRRLRAFVARTRPDEATVPPAVAEALDLRRAVAELPERQRLAVALHYLADLPVDEVASALAVTPSTARSHLQAARRTLAGRLADPPGTGRSRPEGGAATTDEPSPRNPRRSPA